MKPLIHILLVATMLFSSVGVSVASVACVKPSKKIVSCALCKKAHEERKNAEQKAENKTALNKSCCIYTVKHLSVKDEYNKPAQLPSYQSMNVLLPLVAVNTTNVLVTRSYPAHTSATPPCSSVEMCALTSTFRI